VEFALQGLYVVLTIGRTRRREQEQRKKEEERARETSINLIERAHSLIDTSEYPTDPEEKEKYFIQQLAAGETLFRSGNSILGLVCALH
jgi:hypothetical protein